MSTATTITTTSTTATANTPLPHETTAPFITDGGLETTLVFHRGIDLPDFAAFPLLDDDAGRTALAEYFEPYLRIAARDGAGFVIDTPTWRASADWGSRLGRDADAMDDVNLRAVGFARQIAAAHPSVRTVVNGVVGPRGDGYAVGETMSPDEAASYHAPQVRSFAAAGADMVSAVTMTYVDEAIGIVRAATAVGLPVVVSFTVETDGALPSGTRLGDAITEVDDATDGAAAYFMVNCAHPSHFAHALSTREPWVERILSIRANASRMSHEELDAAEELDRGDVAALASEYVSMRRILPDLRVVGGCCGTDDEHIGAISAALAVR